MTIAQFLRPLVIGAIGAGGVLAAVSLSAQGVNGGGDAVVLDSEGYVWHAAGGEVRACFTVVPTAGTVGVNCTGWR